MDKLITSVPEPSQEHARREQIKKSCAPLATDHELDTFIYLSNQYGLDPIKKEIYFIKYGGKATIMTSRDGYLTIAQRNPNFNGMESDAIYEGDRLTKRDDCSILISYGDEHFKFDKAQLRGAFCNVYRKDMDMAVSVLVALKDYKKDNDIWRQYTNAMIIKIAESQALKRAFGISGLVTKEELNEEPKEE
jgi:phage recombination protein Bet